MVRDGTGGRRHPISSDDDPTLLRRGLRLEMRLRRRKLAGYRRRSATNSIVRKLRDLPAYRRARDVALYWPADGEPDIRGLARHARLRGKRLYLPVVGHAGSMRFAPWRDGSRLRRNRYGIPEPTSRRKTSAAQLDLVVMPLVAFDWRGHRLGRGGGYYDRALCRQRRRRPLLVGAAFAFQQAPQIPAMPWDIPLDLVVTERGRRNKQGAHR